MPASAWTAHWSLLTQQGAESDSRAGRGSRADSGSGGGSDSGPLGEAPQSIEDLFISQSNVLLRPGETQVDVGFVYAWQEARRVAVVPVGGGGTAIVLERIRARNLLVPTNLRFGLRDDLELFLSAPFGLSHTEQSDPLRLQTEDVGGIGDVSAGLQYQLVKQSKSRPDVTATLRLTAPTTSGASSAMAVNSTLGRGFWSVQGELNFIKTVDPVVLFGRVGYRHEFEGRLVGLPAQTGETFNYSFGMGFAITDDLAVNAAVNGQWQGRARVGGQLIPNSSIEPISLQLSFSRRTAKLTRMQPFVELGLTDDAPDVVFGVFFIRNFK